MRLPSLFPSKKLRATTARRSLGMPDEMDYEEMSEPNMKLSRALLIVLVLHIVAVAGIIAFNAVKTRQGGLAPTPVAKSAGAKADDSSLSSTTSEKQVTATAKAIEEKPKHTAVAKEEAKIE